MIRCDASVKKGSGHARRQIAIAKELQNQRVDGNDIVFWITDDDYARELFSKEIFKAVFLPQGSPEKSLDKAIDTENPDLVILDLKEDYALDSVKAWKRRTKLVAIDFIGKMTPLLDLTIIPVAGFIPELGEANVIHGVEYVVLNELLKAVPREKRSPQEHIAVVTGGTDPAGVMLRIAFLLEKGGIKRKVVFFPGDGMKQREKLRQAIEGQPQFSIENFSFEKIQNSVACIVTQGISAYETMYLSVPTMIVSHSRENDKAAKALVTRIPEAGYLGYYKDISPTDLNNLIGKFLNGIPLLPGWSPISGSGAENVVSKLMSLINVNSRSRK